MILDSTFLIDVLRGNNGVHELLEDIDASGTPFVSSITVMELYEGIHLSDSTDTEREAVRTLLDEIDEFPFDRDCAVRAGQINADLLSAGEPIGETDVQIAATALVHDQPVVTRNDTHFDRIDEVEVVSY